MRTFLTFLFEANAVGSKFEKQTADMVNMWLKKNNLQKQYDVRRFQSVFENKKVRDEEYSDILVENLKTGEKFFIECKEADRSNVINMQFDIRESGKLVPVKSAGRKELDETELNDVQPFIDIISNNDEYKTFIDFLNTENNLLDGICPAEYYFKRNKNSDVLSKLIKQYNALVKHGGVEADCKTFDIKNIRKSTIPVLICALCWRLSEPENRTWDICHVSDIPNFGDMIRRHYSSGKKIPARYIQFNDKLFQTDDENPFNLKDVPIFPSDIAGKFALKFYAQIRHWFDLCYTTLGDNYEIKFRLFI